MDDYNFYIILRPVDRSLTKFYRIYAHVLDRQLITERDCTGLNDNQWIIERFTLRLDKNSPKLHISCKGNDGKSLEIYEAAFNDCKFLRTPKPNKFVYQGYQIDFILTCDP